MIHALTKQVNYASSILNKYGFDESGSVEYKFNSNGFRNDTDFTDIADIVFAGGSISFGVGVDNKDAYKMVVSNSLNVSCWDVSYASELYSNAIIFKTIMQVYDHLGDKPLITQWVSDKRDIGPVTVYEYLEEVNKKFSNTVHIFMDDREEPNRAYFDLTNPIWVDRVASGTHPGVKTHAGLAKFILKKLNHVTEY